MSRTQTRSDAWDQGLASVAGSLAGEPSVEYLTELRRLMYEFIGRIEAELVAAERREADAETFEAEQSEGIAPRRW